MDTERLLFILQVVSSVLFFVFSVAFVFLAKHAWYLRLAPLALLLAFFLIPFVPEAGWSDVRSQWHQPVAIVLYSVLYFVLGFWLIRSRTVFQSVFAFTSFVAGTSFFAVGIFLVSESWYFYHVLLPYN